jgi:ribose 5-phosphate isomerase B
MKWFAGSDHAGYRLKVKLVEELRSLGDEVVDCGTVNGDDSVDYPDFGVEVARRVSQSGGAALGLLVCGTGIGIAMAANKVAGARAAVVTDCFTARATRAHNDANVICMGERVIGAGVASEALRAFRDTPFEGGRHQRRVEKIGAVDGDQD